ncbi:unnamed protein product [Echinostoma caproni]|uniref:PHD-type domain-containing protein n=1 Tax=Echinostoma caproni TaxID=27848 RepID=A0A183B7Q5_9TREM|nr:unnamed protein product [Echinostoma caproni]
MATTTHTNIDPISEKRDATAIPSSRVRVDSVFTDNESDDNGVSPMPDLIPVNSTLRKVQEPLNPAVKNSADVLSKNPSDSKHNRTQPRTKHTACIPKSVYPPAIRAVSHDSSQVEPVVTRDRTSRKHFPSSSSSTGSSGAKSRVNSVSHRPSSAQVVVATAGSSYYFNSSGEQIWLCPICLQEDDGNLMIGCDSCDDWYHSTCLGLSAEPEDPHWFCPRCAGQSLPVSSGSANLTPGPVQLPPLLSTPTVSGTNRKKVESGHRSTTGSHSKHAKRGTKR